MVIKMETIGRAHAANAISYVLDKEKARKENKPVFLTSNNIELNPLTGKPYSPVEVLMDMQLKLAASKHKVENPFWRIELCPPKEECRDWTMEQWDRFCRDCVNVLDSTDYKTEVVKDKDGQPVIDKQTVGYNVYMRLARVEVDGGDILTFGQHRVLAAHLHFGLSRPLVDDRIAALVPHHLGFIVRRVEHLHTVLAKPFPLLHRPVPALLFRRAQLDAPEGVFCPVFGRGLLKLHVHQHLHGRVRLARQRVQLDVIGGKEDRLVLLPRLLLVEHIADGVGSMRPAYRLHLDHHTLICIRDNPVPHLVEVPSLLA